MSHISGVELKRDFYKLLDELDAGSPGFDIVQAALTQIRRSAMLLSNLGERECNGVMKADGFMGWDDADQKRADNIRKNNEKKILDALQSVFDAETYARLDIEFQGDPRGPSVIVGIKDGRQRLLTVW